MRSGECNTEKDPAYFLKTQTHVSTNTQKHAKINAFQ